MTLTLRNSLELTLTFLLLLTIAIGLTTTDFFYDPTSSPYYGFCITAFFFVIVSSALCLRSHQSRLFKSPILFFGIWLFYIFFQYLTNSATSQLVIYFLALYFLLIGTTALFSVPGFRFTIFLYGIILLSTIESFYCILQSAGICKSHSLLFQVTGSYNNPNVTALFLALTTPVFLYFFSKKYKGLIRICFLILLIALFLLKCRAAFIGTILASAVFYCLEYNFISWVKNKKNKTTAKTLLILGLLIIIPLGSYLYNAKKASSDGRKFIWKLSAAMTAEKPLTGYGYGYFEKEYNLYQASYIKSGKATDQELKNAGPVLMPHNELLYNAVEGGSIGLILTVLFFGSLLFTIKQQKKAPEEDLEIEASAEIKSRIFNLSYAGVTAFTGMSMINSTIQIVPVMCLLVIYGAIICSTLKPLRLPINLLFPKTRLVSSLAITAGIILSLYVLYTIIGIANADSQNKRAKLLEETGHYESALQIMPDLEPYLKEDSDYWKNYGLLYFKTQHYQQALICLKKGQILSSLPDFYIGTGKSYEKLKQYPQAIQEYETLIALYPSKFLYRMLLLKVYIKNKHKAEAISLAREIIQLEPKIPSQKADQYKKMCRILLRQLTPEKKTLF